MTTSPRHMQHLANVRSANNTNTSTAAEITKLVRQYYDPPPAPPYKYEKICQRTSQTILHERPENTYQENYDRRGHNMSCGFYSLPNETYRNVGGHFDLDPYDLVLKTMSDNLNIQVWDHVKPKEGSSRRATPAQKKRRQSLLPPIPSKHSPKPESHEEFCDGGKKNIRNQNNLLYQIVKQVRCGQFYEEIIRQLQDLKAKDSTTSLDSEMVILPIESSYMSLQKSLSPDKTEQVTRPCSECKEEDLLPSEPMNLEEEYFDDDVFKEPPSEQESCVSELGSLPDFKAMRAKRISQKKPNTRKLSIYLRSATSLLGVMNIENIELERKERRKKIHMEFLEALIIIINSLHNMKARDLKSKTPLSIDYMKQLRKEFVIQATCDGVLTNQQSRPVKCPSITTVPSNHDFKGPGIGALFGRKKKGSIVDSMSSVPSKQDKKELSKLLKPKNERYYINLESWEDLLAANPYQQIKKQRKKLFARGVQILVKAVQWQKKMSNMLNVGQDKSLSSISNSGRSSCSPEHVENPIKIESNAKVIRSEPPKKPSPPKRIPIWQKIAAEKPKVYEESKRERKPDPEDLVENMKAKFVKLKNKHQQEVDAEVGKLERERVVIFRYKYGLFDERVDKTHVEFDEHRAKLAKARKKLNTSIESGEVKPSVWYQELKDKANMRCGYGDDVEELLGKIGKHAFMDSKSVHLGKAKLCLIVMSLPAYEICTVAYQTAIKFVLETIMLLDLRNFTDWLELRRVPYNVYDTQEDLPQSPRE